MLCNFQDSPPSSNSSLNSINDALSNLRKAILTSEGIGLNDIDKELQEFLYNWLQNNKSSLSSQDWWRPDNGVHDLSSVEERMLQLETDKERSINIDGLANWIGLLCVWL